MRSLLILALLVGSLPVVAGETEQVVILCYHEVEETATTRYTVARDEFRRQLDFIQSSGYSVVSLDDAVAYLSGQVKTIAPNPVVITIDDGWLCTRTEMYDELAKRELPYTVFVYPKIVSRGDHALTWPMIREMSAGGADIQSHALSHPFLTFTRNKEMPARDYPAWLCRELDGSRREISAEVSRDVKFLAYPFGDFDDAVIVAAKESGYRAAVTTIRGPNRVGDDLFRLKRYLFHADTTLVDLERWLRGGPM